MISPQLSASKSAKLANFQSLYCNFDFHLSFLNLFIFLVIFLVEIQTWNHFLLWEWKEKGIQIVALWKWGDRRLSIIGNLEIVQDVNLRNEQKKEEDEILMAAHWKVRRPSVIDYWHCIEVGRQKIVIFYGQSCCRPWKVLSPAGRRLEMRCESPAAVHRPPPPPSSSSYRFSFLPSAKWKSRQNSNNFSYRMFGGTLLRSSESNGNRYADLGWSSIRDEPIHFDEILLGTISQQLERNDKR